MTGQTPPPDLQLDNALWQMATTLWDKPGFADACLQAQDEGISVTHLLVALYSAEHSRCWSGVEPAPLRNWREQVTEPLRRLRQTLGKDNDAVRALREQIKSAELHAEQVELGWWAYLIERIGDDDHWYHCAMGGDSLAANNLQAAGLDGTRQALCERLLGLWHQHGKGVTLPGHKQN